ncbi:hypothetical protein PFISCL1PPCAC_5892, partial [Pristionchus fissidentatus]
RHRTTAASEVEVSPATRRIKRKRTTTQAPTTTIPRHTRRPATIIPNFHPKEASVDTDSLASLPFLLNEEDEIVTTTQRTKRMRRNRKTTPSTTTTATTTEKPESTTVKRGRPPRVLPKKESTFSLPDGNNRLFYDRDSAPLAVTKSPPTAPPTLTPPTLSSEIPSAALSIEELALLPREKLLEELKKLTEQLSDRVEGVQRESHRPAAAAATTTAAPSLPPRDEDIVDEEDRELMDAITRGKKKEIDPFEFISGQTTTVVTTNEKKQEETDLFKFALPKNRK